MKIYIVEEMKKSLRGRFLFAAAVFGVAANSQAHAATLALYNMSSIDASTATHTSPNSASLAGVTASSFTSDVIGGTAPSEFNQQNLGSIPANVSGLSARSLNGNPANPFWQFTVTSDPDDMLEFTSITLDAGVQSSIGATMWDYNVSWSVDNYASILGTFVGPTTAGASGSAAVTSAGLTIDLSGLPSESSAITFEITPVRILGTSGGTPQRVGWITNVDLEGTVSVPEPGSFVLAIGASACLLGWRVRKVRK